MQDRTIFEKSLSDYPDLLTLADLQVVLGGVCDKTVRDIVRRGEIKYFKDGTQYKIPKEYVVDFMLTDSCKKVMERKMEQKQLVELKRDLIFHRSRLLAFCSSPRSKKEMMLFLNLKSTKLFYSLFLHPLLETGELHRTVQDQLCVSTQKYIRGIRIKR